MTTSNEKEFLKLQERMTKSTLPNASAEQIEDYILQGTKEDLSHMLHIIQLCCEATAADSEGAIERMQFSHAAQLLQLTKETLNQR